MTGNKTVVIQAVLGISIYPWDIQNTRKRQREDLETAVIQKILGLCSHNYGRPRITGCLSECMTNNDTCLVWAAIMKCVCLWGGRGGGWRGTGQTCFL